jgi:hypothetical protein
MIAASERLRLIARRRPSASPGREAGERHRHLDDLVLEDDRAERLLEHGLERRVVVLDDVAGLLAQLLAAVDVRVDRAALDRAGAHDRHLDRDLLERLGARAPQRGHLRAALDLEDAGGVGVLDRRERLGSSNGIRERSIVSPVRRAIRSTQRSTAESIPRPSRSIFRKPASEHESLSQWTICRPVIAAGTTGQQSTSGRVATIIPPECWRGGAAARAPRRRAWPATPSGLRPALLAQRDLDVLADRVGPRLRPARDALDLARRQAERLAELADRPARLVGRERGDERGAVAAVALVHAREQDRAHVAREVEVDVGQRGDLLVEEAPEQQLVLDRVDVAEAGQVADDRGDARPAARGPAAAPRAPRWRRGPRRPPRARARAARGAG